MKKSVRFLIALLSVACISAGSLSLAACAGKSGGSSSGPAQEEVIDGVYVAYAVDDAGNPVANVYIELYKYKSPTRTTIQTLKTGADGKVTFDKITEEEGYKYYVRTGEATVSGDRNSPLGYEEPQDSVEVTNNRATLVYARSTSYYNSQVYELEYKRAYALGSDGNYSYVEGKQLGFYSADDTATALDETLMLDPAKCKEQGATSYTLEMEVDEYKPLYFTFMSQVVPTTVASTDSNAGAETDRRVENSRKAAAGQYTFTVDVIDAQGNVVTGGVSTNGVVMEEYSRIEAGKGVAEYSTKSGVSTDSVTYSGTNSFTCEWDSEYSTSTKRFGVTSTSACTVRVTVQRVGDVQEKIVSTVNKTFSSEIAQAEKGNGTAVYSPMDDTTIYKGEDGYYHLYSTTGPILYIALNKLDKVNIGEYKVSEAYQHTGDNGNVTNEYFYLGSEESDPDYDDNYHYVRYNYLNMVLAYSAKTNSDGLYPVNDDLYSFLKLFGANTLRVSNCTKPGTYGYLSMCMYYNDGEVLSGEGSSTSPYVLDQGVSTTVDMTNLDGTAYMTFTAKSEGYYSITSEGALKAYGNVGSDEQFSINGALYVRLEANKIYTFTVSGSDDAYAVTINSVSQLAASEEQGNNSSTGESYTTYKGTDADHALSVIGIGKYEVIMNPDVGNGDGVYISWKVARKGDGTYKFKVYGSDAMLVYGGDKSVESNCYNSEKVLTIEAVEGQTYSIYLTLKKLGDGKVLDTSYLLSIEKYDTESMAKLQEGDNDVTGDYDGNIEYAFTGSGTYKFVNVSNTYGIKVNGDNITANTDSGADYYSGDMLSDGYTFTIADGQTITINVFSDSSTDNKCQFQLVKQD